MLLGCSGQIGRAAKRHLMDFSFVKQWFAVGTDAR